CYVIPDQNYQRGYRGGSIWATAAVDPATGYAYVGTGNPSTRREDPRTNAILKIDLVRTRSTFGDIVGVYKGTSNLSLDLDFGASPQLFQGASGRTLVGELQKSGVYHSADAATMQGVWTTKVGPPSREDNAATAATNGRAVFVEGAPPGELEALDVQTGHVKWIEPIGDVIHYEAITVAGGVVYTVDSLGNLDGFDAGTGRPLLRWPVWLGRGGGPGPIPNASSASVSVARHTVYVSLNGAVVALRPARR
ncbi:MAG TPA: PQQ-binding-like beta-propeller repeat protein, partial [Actinomycetota bacterium]